MRFLAVMATALLLTGCSSLASKDLVGQEAPFARMYKLSDGTQVNLSDYRGKYTALVFWATTCRASTPMLRRLADYRQRHHNAQIVLLSLDKQEDLSKVRDRIRYDRLNQFDNMFSGNEDYDEAFSAMKGERLPYVVVLDPAGRIVAVDTDDDVIYEYLK